MEHQEASSTLGLSADSVSQPEDSEAVGPGSSELTGRSPACSFVSLQVFVWKLSAQPVAVGGGGVWGMFRFSSPTGWDSLLCWFVFFFLYNLMVISMHHRDWLVT